MNHIGYHMKMDFDKFQRQKWMLQTVRVQKVDENNNNNKNKNSSSSNNNNNNNNNDNVNNNLLYCKKWFETNLVRTSQCFFYEESAGKW